METKYTVKNIEKKRDHLSIKWGDNFKSKFHFLWLRDNCPTAIHPTANMRVFNILTVSKKIFPKEFKVQNRKLNISWSENAHESQYELKWLRDHCYTEINNKKYISPYKFWDGSLKKNFNKIKLDHDDILKENRYLKKWLGLLNSYGFAIVKNSPTKKKICVWYFK